MGELRTHVAELALSAASALVRKDMDGSTQRRLVEEFLAEATPGALDARAKN